MPSREEYYSWRTATFGRDYDIWHDGLMDEGVPFVTGEARQNVLVMLRTGLELKDPYAAKALAAMGDVDTIPELRVQLAQADGNRKVSIALAINTLSSDESLSNNLVEVLQDDSLSWSTRYKAAIGLREFQDEISERALLGAIEHDVDYLVRYHASESLLKRWLVEPSNIMMHRAIFNLITAPNLGPISADDQARLSEAVVRLRALRTRDE